MKLNILLVIFVSLFLGILACENNTAKDKASPDQDQEKYISKGKAIAGATFSALSGKLKTAMEAGGVTNAVQYCNLAAMPLVDSLSKIHQATIRRTSGKVRNPMNQPTPEERLILDIYEKKVQAGEPLPPIVRSNDDQTIAFYAPIHTMSFCLQCHGKVGETLQATDYDLIKKLYPEDQAIGYAEGDFRGMWSIGFGKDGGRGTGDGGR